MKRDVAAGKLDHILREVDEDIRAGHLARCRDLSDAPSFLDDISLNARHVGANLRHAEGH